MSEDNQLIVPQSFIDLYVPQGRIRPTESVGTIAKRYEFCEDMAQLLTEHARTKLFELGVAEQDVLDRIHQGLVAGDQFSTQEAWWVARRLAELLEWPVPDAILSGRPTISGRSLGP
jgi:hypothetical protein